MNDQIVLVGTGGYAATATSDLFKSNEVRTVTAITGNTITLNSPLAYAHASEIHDLAFDTQISLLSLHKQGEVGLLSRSIQITGDSSSSTTQFGVQITALSGSRAYVSGVQLSVAGMSPFLWLNPSVNTVSTGQMTYNVTNTTSTYRYPFQWDTVGDATGQYFQDSTIYNSFYGCAAAIGTNKATINNNLCFQFNGSGFAVDQGSETGNIFNGNLGVAAV